MQKLPGTYFIVCEAKTPRNIRIGARGLIAFNAGFYLYVGSAFGPGVIKARVGRHCLRRKTARWHIDYLTAWFRPNAVLVSYDIE